MTFLPNYVFIDDSSIEIEEVQSVEREEMSNGMARLKLINSLPIMNISFEVSLHQKNFEHFLNWYNVTLLSARDFFLMRSPLNGKITKYRFLKKDRFRKVRSIYKTKFTLEYYYE